MVYFLHITFFYFILLPNVILYLVYTEMYIQKSSTFSDGGARGKVMGSFSYSGSMKAESLMAFCALDCKILTFHSDVVPRGNTPPLWKQ